MEIRADNCIFHAIGHDSIDVQTSLVAQMVKNPSAVESWVQSLGWEDRLEEGMATHSSILAWRISMDRGAWLATVTGVAKTKHSTVMDVQDIIVSYMCKEYLPLKTSQNIRK